MNLSLKSVSLLAALIATSLTRAHAEAPKLKALIVDGQNNHSWQTTTPVMKAILEQSGRFEVAVATTPPKGQPMPDFKPNFKAYKVIVLNYNGDEWPAETKKAFVEYVRGGGGVVVVHAANNSFPKWPEYNEIIGLGGWGGRNENAGPLVRYRDGKIVFDDSPGRAGMHPPQHEYQVVTVDGEHPIMKGLPAKWMHVADELYGKLRGPAKNLTLLATAYSDPKLRNGTGENEPALFTIHYGNGRIFHTILGHGPDQMKCVGFIVTLVRGAEWAATGQVTQTAVPADFPTADKSSARELTVVPHPNATGAPPPRKRGGGKTPAATPTQPPAEPLPLDAEVLLKAQQCTVHGTGAGYEAKADRDCIGNWKEVDTWVSWDLAVKQPGTFTVFVEQSMMKQAGSKYRVEIGGQSVEGTVKDTGDWATFQTIELGTVRLAEAGTYTLAFRPISKTGTYLLNLKSVKLKRIAE